MTNLNIQSAKQRIEFLSKELTHHSKLYYIHDAPTISDETYDQMFRELLNLEKQYPQFNSSTSPTKRVGSKLEGDLPTRQHTTPMLSLDNAFNDEETVKEIVKAFSAAGVAASADEVNLLSDSKSLDLIAEPKMDGLAISLEYINNELMYATTRGDGSEGFDVTHSIKTIRSIPLKLDTSIVIPRIEIRGEVYMPKSAFEQINKELTEIGKKTYVNPRNAASGIVKRLDPRECSKRNLAFIPYSIGAHNGYNLPETQMDLLLDIKSMGFNINPETRVLNTLKEVEDYHDEQLSKRHGLPFEIDGIVYKINKLSLQEEAGLSLRTPKWAFARKFPSEEASTVLLGVKFQVGRTGSINPVAILQPIFVGGVTVSNITMHNQDQISGLGIKIGDTVTISRRGDVIPALERLEAEGQSREDIVFPTNCPSCGSPVVRAEGEATHYCTNSFKCDAQKVERIIYFASKPCLNIDGLGEKTIEALYELGKLDSITDIYRLTEQDILSLPRKGVKSASNAINAINKAKKTTLNRFIAALGIPEVGDATSIDLAEQFKDIDTLISSTYDDLISIEGIGSTVAGYITNFFSNADNKQVIKELIELGVEIEAKKEVVNESGIDLSGQTWVVTGAMTSMTRDEIKERLRSMGAAVTGSISKKTTALVVGTAAGSKLAKANSINEKGGNIDILDEESFMSRFVLAQ